MTVNSASSTASYAGNGSTKSFPVPFRFLADSHLTVETIDGTAASPLELGTDYTVRGAGSSFGGAVDTLAPVARGITLRIIRNPPVLQLVDYVNAKRFPASDHEKALDYLTMVAQAHGAMAADALKLAANRRTFDARGLRVASLSTAIKGRQAVPLAQAQSLAEAGGIPAEVVQYDDLASSAGAHYTGYTPSRGVSRLLDDLWNQGLTVENFGAVGDGATDDSSAFATMLSSVGYVALRKKTYFVGNWGPPTTNTIVIVGAGKPMPNPSNTGLVDGTGSIVVGRMFLRASQFYLKDFGVDVGDTRALITTSRDGLIADAPVGGYGYHSYIANISSCGKSTSDASHGLLHEGFEGFRIENCDVFQHNFGVVVKSRNGFVSNIRGYGVKVATVYAKGSLSEVAGDVADGSVNNVIINGVVSRSFTSTTPQPGIGVWVHSEGTAVINVIVNDVTSIEGRCAFRVSADAAGGYYVSGCSASGIRSANQIIGWETLGVNYETSVDRAHIENPSSAVAFGIDANSTNWRATDTTLVITLGTITGTSPALMGGIGAWDGFTVRNNNVANMAITHSLTAVRSGRMNGNVVFFGGGNLTLGPGVTAAAGEITPQVALKPDTTIVCSGVVNPSSASSGVMATLAGALNFGTNRYFTVPARTTGGTRTTANLIASGTSLTLLSPAASTLNQVSLDGVIIHRT